MSVSSEMERREISVRGIVQGVGFRPFVYSLARHHRLSGLVRNDARGVCVEVEGPPERVEAFLRGITEEAPPLAVIEAVTWRPQVVRGDGEFRIEASQAGAETLALVSPDVATCAHCLQELFDRGDRRYRYPFINCTNCGPRFTITRSVPYDRAMTTMAAFALCAACRQEYEDPANRRFHAQPNACPACGPRARLVNRAGADVCSEGDDAIACAAGLLREGAILAVKGLGGYHLACDPFNSQAVDALRNRKARQDKPFAVMARDLQQVRELCDLTPADEALLTAPARPIVLQNLRGDPQGAYARLAEGVAPRQKTLGVMLAYTPLHHLLLHDTGIPLVMTSGNRSDEPIVYRDEDAIAHLGHIADYFLGHNRPIHMRCDDSVVRVYPGSSGGAAVQAYPVRRSRGYAPAPLAIAQPAALHTLACGAQLKNTFCLVRDSSAFVSPHMGDLENYESVRAYREGIAHYCRLFDITPALIACDLHPGYGSTAYAREREEEGLPLVAVQHHHAHIASCLADNERPAEERVIGVAFDGTGYGTDGTIWGGEFLEGSVREGFTRRAHLDYAPLPGGEAAIREPWRAAVAYLLSMYGEGGISRLSPDLLTRVGERRLRLVRQLLELDRGISWLTPQTSSAGRLFDAVAALLGVPGSERTTYEGQAAIELELIADGPASSCYPFTVRSEGAGWVVETRDIVAAVVEDIQAGRPTGAISSRFHRTMAEIVVAACRRLRQEGGVRSVALSGGTFGNHLLLRQSVPLLERAGFMVYLHRRVPANDGGLSLGQAVLAESTYRRIGA